MDWTPDLSVGVDMIDNQHKELIRRMNAFFDSMNSDNQKNVLDMLSFLESYVVSHFRDEEALQEKHSYPGLTAHKKLHQAFMQDVKKLANDIKTIGFTVATKSLVGVTLTAWLMLHIKKEDKAVGAFILS